MGASTQTLWLTGYDVYLFGEGTHLRAYEKLGAHPGEVAGRRGVHFAVWAPNAARVSVVGDHNRWDPGSHPMEPRANAGLWETFIPDLGSGALYKYHIDSREHGYQVATRPTLTAMPPEIRPSTASRVWDLSVYSWGDHEWSWRSGRRGIRWSRRFLFTRFT